MSKHEQTLPSVLINQLKLRIIWRRYKFPADSLLNKVEDHRKIWMSVSMCKNQFFDSVETWMINLQYVLVERLKILSSGLSRINVSAKKWCCIGVVLWCGLLWCRLLGDVPLSNFRPWNVGLVNSVILQEDRATAHYAADVHFSP